jgi:3-hydroxymyristoyl/3-hydroxydecanoyl-(acyl carrier protein) dehydratases
MFTLYWKSMDELSLIPQQPPFVLVDRLLQHEADSIVAGFTVPEQHVLVDRLGVLSEAGVMEHFAQTIALHQGYDHFKRNLPPPVGYIGSIRNFEIFHLPRAGDELRTSVTILQRMFGVTIVQGEVTLDGRVIASGEMRTVTAK